MSAEALVVMVKSPEPGRVKTRLVPPLSKFEAATLYTRFIADTFNNLSSLGGIKIYSALLKGDGSAQSLNFSLPDGVERFEQVGGDLGERLTGVFKRLFDEGFERVAVIGSDSPDLPLKFIEDAFKRLRADSSKVVLGPAEDGGYYLIAMGSLDERPFDDAIRWSTDTVLTDTMARLGEDALLLEPWYDIDGPEDIAKLDGSAIATESVAYIMENDIFNRCRDKA